MVDNPVTPPAQIPVVMPPQLPPVVLSEVVGFGYPDASKVLDALLGLSGGKPVRSRVSPMYTVYSPSRGDIGQTANPHQFMKWRWLFGFNSQPPMATSIAPNANWWFPEGGFDPPLRRAAFFVFTTDVVPKATWADTYEMRPVFHIGKPLSGPPSIPVSPADYEHHLAVGESDLNGRLASGYKLLGRQGFLVSPTKITVSCTDIDLSDVLRYCNSTDCVLLPLGHAVPTGYSASGVSLGCAVATIDSDADGLPDGFEAILGTNSTSTDSDFDGCPDGVEYPLNALPTSDPAVATGGCP